MNKNNRIPRGLFYFFLTFLLINTIPLSSAILPDDSCVKEKEPDWSKIDGYGVPEDEEMEVYGEPVEINEADIIGHAAGEVHTLTKAQFKEVWGRIIKWREGHGGVWPKYVDISKYHVGINRISYDTYMKMHSRWNQWINSHNGQEPTIIGIEGSIGSGVLRPSHAGPIQKKLMGAVGSFNTFTGFYNQCKGRGYSFYAHTNAHSWYSRDVAIQRLKNRQGLNCVDVSQLGYALAKEMGYQVKFQETYCPKENVGHVLLKVKGHELGNDWVVVDLAACISVNSRAPLGHHWCNKPYDAHHNWVE